MEIARHRRPNDDPDLSPAAIARAFGTPKPTLTHSYQPGLLYLRTFPALMGYSSRIMAESWESNNLFFAALADRDGRARLRSSIRMFRNGTAPRSKISLPRIWKTGRRCCVRCKRSAKRHAGSGTEARLRKKQWRTRKGIVKNIFANRRSHCLAGIASWLLVARSGSETRAKPHFHVKVDMVVLELHGDR